MYACSTRALGGLISRHPGNPGKSCRNSPRTGCCLSHTHTHTPLLQHLENNHLELNLKPFCREATVLTTAPMANSKIKRVVAEAEGRKRRITKQQRCVHPPNTTVKFPNKSEALLSSDLLPEFNHFFPLFHSVCQF